MALEQTANFAVSTVATAPSPATSGTSLVVGAGHGARFPAASFNAVVCPAAQQPTPDNAEIVRVTAKSTDTFTITRAQESTSARSIVVGDRIFAGMTVAALTDIYNTITFVSGAITGIPDAKGDLVGASADNVLARVPAGSNTFVPIYDSTQTAGIRTGIPLAAPAVGIEIARSQGTIAAGVAAGTFGFNLAAALGAGSVASQPQGVVDIVASEFAVTGLTPKLKTKLIIETNPTAPAITFTGGLSLLSTPTGGANTLTTAWGAVVTSPDTRAAVVNPAATSYVSTLSSSYVLPSDGRYVLTVTTTSGMAATNPRVNTWCILYLIYE